MFDCLEIGPLPPGPRFAATLRFWINGEDVADEAVDGGGCGRPANRAVRSTESPSARADAAAF